MLEVKISLAKKRTLPKSWERGGVGENATYTQKQNIELLLLEEEMLCTFFSKSMTAAIDKHRTRKDRFLSKQEGILRALSFKIRASQLSGHCCKAAEHCCFF